MSAEIKNLQPTPVWECFYALTQIPRPSKHEGKASEYVAQFGRDLGLETHVDKVGNVVIRKPATPGYENRKGIVLQAHIDMVPQKNSDVQHDFTKDPIDAYIDGEWVRARGTTLGADNGIGAAAAMAVLKAKDLQHGPIEALFTIDEETGMTGANNLSAKALKGEILLNLDSETEGELYVGCAGGLDATISIPYTTEAVQNDREGIAITIEGLKGGHSGMDIPLGRANSIKLLVRLLNHADRLDARLVSFEGGSLRNAIPREASAVVAVPRENADKFLEEVSKMEAFYQHEFAEVDPGIRVTAKRCAIHDEMMTVRSHRKVVRSLFVCPNGVIRMSNAMPGLVETSTNMAKVQMANGVVTGQCLLRSSVDSAKQALAEKMAAVFKLAGAKVKFDNGYPGWQPNMQSPILAVMRKQYHKAFGKEPKVMAVHAGLECGILGGVYPNMDMISFGPTIQSPHSPDERVNIETVGTFWDFLCHVLSDSPVK